MSKIRLLVIDIENAGVGKFRFRDPHMILQKNYRDEFHIDIITNPAIHDKSFVSNYDMIFLQGSMLINDNAFKIFEDLKKDGMKLIVDLDDYWRLPMSHGMYKKMEDNYKKLTQRLLIADLITTTTVELGREILKFNKNVKVIPNAVNPDESQFQPKPIESERVRIGWVGGASHLEDLKMTNGLFNKLQGISTKNQMVMCGFNNNTKNIETGKIEKVKYPKVWMECEYVFTNGYSVDEEYKHYLLHPKEEEFEGVEDKPYRRIWTKDFYDYAHCYNHIDISLAPLVNNQFNRMKSQLKVIEAGFHKKPIIVSDISPYNLDCRNLLNSFVVNEKRQHKEWFQYAKKLIESPSLREDVGLALYETVKDKYNLHNVCKIRRQIYRNLMTNGN
jgi:glycosyltransferase involved in cell wall biosynthesis